MDNEYIELLHRLSLKYKVPVAVVKKAVESQFEFIQETTKELDFNEVKTKEEFNGIKSNFNIRYLFTLYTSYNSLIKIKERKKKRDEAKSSDSKKP